MKTPKIVRGSLLDLVLVVGVVMAVWSRTPVGNLGARALNAAMGWEVQAAPISSTFSTRQADLSVLMGRISAHLQQQPEALVERPAVEGEFPEPYRSAVSAALAETPVPEAHLALVDTDRPLPEQHLMALDALQEAGADPQQTLLRYALDTATRDRAISRARQAGDADPGSWESLRRYLPRSERQRGDRLISTTLGTAKLLTLKWPVATDTKITSPFGFRDHPILAKRKFHNGVDLSVPTGTPLWAAQDGTIKVASHDAINGNYVIIDHGGGLRTSYCHMDSLDVERKDLVTRGQQIGLSGSTGRSTGPHLHFVVRVGGKAVDPQAFLVLDAVESERVEGGGEAGDQ